MSRRAQRGQTLIELLVGMAVTTLILGSLVGVLYAVGSNSLRWAARVDQASVGDALTAALQADTHRYPPCSPTTWSPTLTFTARLAGSTGTTYTYRSRPDGYGGYEVMETTDPNPTGPLIERLPGQPMFQVTPPMITVKVPNLTTRGPLVVFYAPPPAGYCS